MCDVAAVMGIQRTDPVLVTVGPGDGSLRHWGQESPAQ